MKTFDSDELLQRFRDGSNFAAGELFDRYVERLIRLARNKTAPKLRRRIDPEDVVQSAYRSFFVHATEGRYQVDKAGDLWKLLASITLNKLHGQVEKHTASRRDFSREEVTSSGFIAPAHLEPTPGEVVAVLEQLSLICSQLTDDERRVLARYCEGRSNDQLADSLQKSPRTVRRILNQVLRRFEGELQQSARKNLACPSSQMSLPDSYPLLSYENYTLEKLVGCGGMGKVYRATAKQSGKVVALKTLHKAKLADVRAMQQFLQEAQLLAKLRHPNIVALDGIGRFPGGSFFLVMDFFAGGDLQSRIDATGPFPVTEAIKCLKLVADGVDFAHASGIVHCDLKPPNILMSDAGIPIVSDFGFAQLAAPDRGSRLTSVGGTRGYLAPEVLHSARPSIAADIYSLGALLWTLVTGSPPTGELAVPTDDKYGRVAEICRKCLAPAPSQRYPTAKEFAAELGTVLKR